MTASIIAEALTLIAHFPYDMIKCRLQSKNYFFKYKNLPHAFKKIVREDGVMGLYQGATPFFVTYVTFVALQFTIYESYMKFCKHGTTDAEWNKKEM